MQNVNILRRGIEMTEDEARELFRQNQAWKSIRYISWYCHMFQSCNKCTIKEWCKNKKNKCPEEWVNN